MSSRPPHSTEPRTWSEPDATWRDKPARIEPFHYELTGAVLAVIAAIFIGRAIFAGDDGYWSNVYLTVLGVVITVLTLTGRQNGGSSSARNTS